MAMRPTVNISIGALSPQGYTFSPLTAVSKYPYTFIKGKDLQAEVAANFFSEGRFWRRTWRIYYVWPPVKVSRNPLYLVPADQVREFFQEINQKLKCDLSLDTKAAEDGLMLDFPRHPDLRPRYLGTIRSRNEYNDLQDHIPSPAWRPDDEISPIHEPSAEAINIYREVTDLALDAGNAQRRAIKEKKQADRVTKQQGWLNDLKVLEQYLGLRPARGVPEVLTETQYNKLTWPELQAHLAATDKKPLPTPPIDPHLPAPYPFLSSVVFICVDLENYERDHHKITEIGFATLDTLDIGNLPPGPNGINWRTCLKAAHLRIREHAHLNNTDFVAGCADRFQFGDSEFISLAEAPAIIASYFRGAAMAGGDMTGRRTVVLVGHDINNDIGMMRRLGYDVANLGALHRVLDTSVLQRAYAQTWNQARLGAVLDDLDIEAWFLHNAGNDAVYTLQALVGLGVRSACERGLRKTEIGAQVEKVRGGDD